MLWGWIMKKISKKIDINSHIEDLNCEISLENGNVIAKISFTNLGDGDITAIKFNGAGYNSFGDIVPINGKDKFFLIIQDIVIKKNEMAIELRAELPNADIKKLELEECQICYADGNVVSYDGENCLTFELEEIDNTEQLSALHKMFDKNVKFVPKDFEQGWVCACGRFNKHEKGICSKCQKNKLETIHICSEDTLKKLVEEYKISEERDRAAREAEQKRLDKKKKKRNILIGVAALACIILAILISHAVQISHRTTYLTEEDMKEALQGTWIYYDNGYRARSKLNIDNDTLTKRWVSLGSNSDLELVIKEWNPKEGTFKAATGTYTVLSNGNIRDEEGNEYEKGGDW